LSGQREVRFDIGSSLANMVETPGMLVIIALSEASGTHSSRTLKLIDCVSWALSCSPIGQCTTYLAWYSRLLNDIARMHQYDHDGNIATVFLDNNGNRQRFVVLRRACM
jgi:hypothetical protein